MDMCFVRRAAGLVSVIFIGIMLSSGASAASVTDQGDRFANDGNYGAAVQAFAEAHRLKPQDAVVAAELAQADLLLGRDKQAVQGAQDAAALDPGNAEYQMLLGDAYSHYVNDVSVFSKLGIAHKVRDAYQKAVDMDPGNADAHFRLAMFYLAAPGIAGGSDERAGEQIRALEKIDPVMASILRARQARKARHYAQTESILRKSAPSGKDGSAYLELGDFLASRGQPMEALAAYRQATAAHPEEPYAYYQIGVLAAEGKIDAQAGVRALEAYLAMPIDWREGHPPYCDAHYRLAQIWARLGDTSKADAEYQKALMLNPGLNEPRPKSGEPRKRKRGRG